MGKKSDLIQSIPWLCKLCGRTCRLLLQTPSSWWGLASFFSTLKCKLFHPVPLISGPRECEMNTLVLFYTTFVEHLAHAILGRYSARIHPRNNPSLEQVFHTHSYKFFRKLQLCFCSHLHPLILSSCSHHTRVLLRACSWRLPCVHREMLFASVVQHHLISLSGW